MTVPAAVPLVAAVAAVCLTAGGPQALVTVAQRDANRSPRAPRSADISTDGRFVAFESQARLVAADVDDLHDIYVLDRTTGQVTLETSGSDDECSHPRISGDGRYVVYESRPSSAQASPRADIALRDRVEGTTRVISQSARSTGELFGWSRSPDISDDGHVIAFSSAATTLGQGPDVNGAAEDIYLVQLPALTITRASVLPSGAQLPRGDSILPSLSADGRWLAFASTAALGGDAGADGSGEKRARPVRQVFLRDAVGGRLTRVSRAAGNGQPNGDSSLPGISADGRFVTFVSEASNLSPDDQQPHCRRLSLRPRARNHPSRQPSRGRLVSKRREHQPGDRRQRPLRRLSIERLEPGLRQKLLRARRRHQSSLGRLRLRHARRAASFESAKMSSAAGWSQAPVRLSTARGSWLRFLPATPSMPTIALTTSTSSFAPSPYRTS